MKISIIIPCSSRHQVYLPELLQVLEKQVRERVEVIMVVNQPKDEIVKKLKSLGSNIRIFPSNKNSPAYNRNLGVKRARGELLVFTDADCLPGKEWFVNLIGALGNNDGVQGIDVALGKTLVSSYLEKSHNKYLLNNFSKGKMMAVDSRNLLLKKKVFEKVGGFDTSFPTHEDRDLGRRLYEAGYKIILSKNAVVKHRYPRACFLDLWHWGLWYGRGEYLFEKKRRKLSRCGMLKFVLLNIISSLKERTEESCRSSKLRALIIVRELGISLGKLKAWFQG